MIPLQWAEAFFDERIFNDAWLNADDAKRKAALVTAETQIKTLTLRSPPASVYRTAVCLQALYLLEKTPHDRKRDRDVADGVTSRRVGDAGETYNKEYSTGLIDPEALAVLKRYIRRRAGGIR